MWRLNRRSRELFVASADRTFLDFFFISRERNLDSFRVSKHRETTINNVEQEIVSTLDFVMTLIKFRFI
jgi:hypothetical protein